MLYLIIIVMISSLMQAKDKGLVLFDEKKYDEAVKHYNSILQSRKYDKAAEYSLGASNYYLNDIDAALKSFESVLSSEDKLLQSKAYFNIARILQDKNEMSKSLGFYKKSLELNPDDLDAKINYELLKKMLNDGQQNSEGQENQDGQQNSDKQENLDEQQSSFGQQQSKDKAQANDNNKKLADQKSEKSDQILQAEAILDAIKGQEKINQKQKILRSKSVKYSKDW